MRAVARSTPSRHHQGIRFLVLLIALLLALNSLSTHAAMDTHQADCGVASSMQQFDDDASDDSRCSACSMVPHLGSLSAVEPLFPTVAPALAMTDHRMPPPRRPPKA
ncbi:hypothetical protein QPM17_23265 [Marinobacter sp. TBZ242]|uniref:DUF2946 domain-containing protein n=1 Tax=Marinobacter azerbaijanicus TaxID=3050455 RepID=A0ABT7IIR1_9GAMM|nr:hypothetical protein [Marinobacter sp. TBZ242]MDL0434064.1 hypothetical protein [Marinobacter sp. TBZ242]